MISVLVVLIVWISVLRLVGICVCVSVLVSWLLILLSLISCVLIGSVVFSVVMIVLVSVSVCDGCCRLFDIVMMLRVWFM